MNVVPWKDPADENSYWQFNELADDDYTTECFAIKGVSEGQFLKIPSVPFNSNGTSSTMITLKFSIISFFIYNLLIYIYLYVFIYIHNFSWQYHIYHQLAIFRRLGLKSAATKVGGLSYFPYYLASHQILHVAGERREEMRMFLLIINHILQDILAGNVDRLSIFLDTAGIVLHASHKQGLEIVQQIPVALDGAIHLLPLLLL